MAGILVPFLPMTAFDFSFLTTGSKSIVVHPGLNVTGYYFARMIVRVHQIDISTGSARSIRVSAFGTNPSKEDPQEFVLSSSTLEVTVNSSAAVGLQSATA
jgi:hypothetical protein